MPKYYEINEAAAKRAKDMNSFSDYKPGSATSAYRQMVDKAYAIAERQKARVDPMYHDKIDALVDRYAKKLAANLNESHVIDGRVPSILIAGGGNFPVRKKEKQNAARDRNMQEWQDVQGILNKIRSTGMGGISMDDPQAAAKLEAWLSPPRRPPRPLQWRHRRAPGPRRRRAARSGSATEIVRRRRRK